MLAAIKGHEGCIKALLDAGADKEAKDKVSSRDVSDALLTADDHRMTLRRMTLRRMTLTMKERRP